MRQNRVLAIRGVRQQLLVAVNKRLLLIAILYAFLPHRASEKDTDNNLSERAAAPTANPKQLTEASESVDSSFDERSLRVDLVRLDRAVPAARCVGSRSPCASAPAQCPAAQIAEASGPQQHRPPVARWALSPGSRGAGRPEDCKAGDVDELAPRRLPSLLALEIPTARWPAEDNGGHSPPDPRDECRKPALGRTADTRRAA